MSSDSNLSYGDRLREQAMLILETGKLLGDLIADFHHLNGASRKNWDRLFIRQSNDWTRDKVFKTETGRPRLDIRGKPYCDGGEALEEVDQRSCG